MLGIVNIVKKEYKEDILGIIDYRVTFFGIPIYTVKFSTTNRDIVGKLSDKDKKTLHICGFTNNKEQ